MAKTALVRCSCGMVVQMERGFIGWKKKKCPGCQKTLEMKEIGVEVVKCPGCGNSVTYDVKLGDKNICPVCNHALTNSVYEQQHETAYCPYCRSENETPIGAEECTCTGCHRTFAITAETRRPPVARRTAELVKWPESERERYLIYRMPQSEYAYGSHMQVEEGQYALLLRNGQYEMALGPGAYVLEDSLLPLDKRLVMAVGGEEAVFDISILYVRARIPDALRWGTPDPVVMTDCANPLLKYRITTNGTAGFDIVDAREFAAKNDFHSLTCEQASFIGDVGGVAPSPLVVAVRAAANRAFDACIHEAEGRSWRPEQLDEHRMELERMLADRLNEDREMARWGLHATGATIGALHAALTEEGAKEMETARVRAAREKRILEAAQSKLNWTASPITVHMAGNDAMKATVTLGGQCDLKVVDREAFLNSRKIAPWLERESADGLTRELEQEMKMLVQNVQTDYLQYLIDERQIDLCELAPCFRDVRNLIQDEMKRRLGEWGADVSYLMIELIAWEPNANLRTARQLDDQKVALQLKQARLQMEQTDRRMDSDATIDQAEEDSRLQTRLAQIRSGKEDALSEARRQDAERNSAERRFIQNLENQQQDDREAREHLKRIQQIDRETELAQARRAGAHQIEMADISRGGEADRARDQLQAERLVREQESTFALWQLQNRQQEAQLSAELNRRSTIQGADAKYAGAQSAAQREERRLESEFLRQNGLADADYKRMLSDILHRIEASDLEITEKLDAYARLKRNADFDDELRRTTDGAEAQARAQYSLGHVENVLTEQQLELCRKLAESEDARAERVESARFAREMEKRRMEIAHEMELLRAESEREDRYREIMKRLAEHAQAMEEKKLDHAHEEAMGRQSGETRRDELRSNVEIAKAQSFTQIGVAHEEASGAAAKAGAQSASELARSIREDIASAERIAREDTRAERARQLDRRMREVEKALKEVQKRNRDAYEAGRASAQSKNADSMTDGRVRELVDFVKALIAKIPSDASAERPDYRGASRASAVYRCPVCGRLIRSGESYCPDCGMRL